MAVIERLMLKVVRTIGRVLISPPPPRATGGYGLAGRGALLLLFLIGVVVAWLAHPGVGIGIMIVAALALLQFLVLQYEAELRKPMTLGWLLLVAAVLGVVIGLFWSDWSGRDGAAGDVLVLTVVVTGAIVLAIVRRLFTAIFGPHHPVSALPDLDDPPPLWFWIGSVADTHATVVVRVAADVDVESVVLRYEPATAGNGPSGSETEQPNEHRFARFELTDLEPDQRYELRVHAPRRDGERSDTVNGSFTTFPPAGEPAKLTMAFGSCMSTGSKGWVFDTITDLEPRIFVITGDLHYENLTSKRTEKFLDVYDRVHASTPLSRLFRSTPIAYVWDDHDFGDNDSDHSSPSKAAAQEAYRQAVPSYTTHDSGAIHQEFTIGRVLVLITDNRSERGETTDHLIQPEAETWLTERISDPTWPVVLWVSPTPWIGSKTTSDNWGAYGKQRADIANAIGARNANLVMVSGDAHMIAIDDGVHTGYGDTGTGFPVLHAAALDRSGSVKGGPFSHGRFPGGGHFGLVTVDDRGREIAIELSGRSWTGAEVISHSFTIPVDNP